MSSLFASDWPSSVGNKMAVEFLRSSQMSKRSIFCIISFTHCEGLLLGLEGDFRRKLQRSVSSLPDGESKGQVNAIPYLASASLLTLYWAEQHHAMLTVPTQTLSRRKAGTQPYQTQKWSQHNPTFHPYQDQYNSHKHISYREK